MKNFLLVIVIIIGGELVQYSTYVSDGMWSRLIFVFGMLIILSGWLTFLLWNKK